MVLVHDTLEDSCVSMEKTLLKFQPKLQISPFVHKLSDYLTKSHGDEAKKIKTVMSSICGATESCSICSAALQKSRSALITLKPEWEELRLVPSHIVVVCSDCSRVSSLTTVMTAFSENALLDSEGSSDLSMIVEHFLRVNGHKLSEISIFNSVLSLSVSLKLSVEKLGLTEVMPQDDIDSIVASLVKSQ